jgi:hypothetical protein
LLSLFLLSHSTLPLLDGLKGLLRASAVFALGDVKYDVLRYLDNRKALEILKLETRYMKKRDKGAGLKAIVRSAR